MLYGLCGASGTGKTTLGGMVEETMDVRFVSFSTTRAAKELGFNPVGSLSLEERIELQEGLLQYHNDLVNKLGRPVILDRTPIDLLAYMLAEVTMQAHQGVSRQVMERIHAYADRCMASTHTHYDFIFLLCTLPEYEETPHRPALNPAYQRHTDMLMRGALASMSHHLNYALINTPDPDTRLEYVTDMIERRVNAHQIGRKQAILH